MTESTQTSVTIDIKKARIRIFKTTIHALGDPKYIQLLVNPNNRTVAIRFVEKETSGDQNHKVKITAGDSYEIYSRAFVSKLYEIVGGLDPKYSYRMTGEIVPKQKMAVFSMDTIVRNEN
jgi:hypothetical protein